jgi:hypothetical protein
MRALQDTRIMVRYRDGEAAGKGDLYPAPDSAVALQGGWL